MTSSASSGLRGGVSIAVSRLRSRGFYVSFGLAFALTVVAALVEKSVSPYGSVDRALGIVFSWVIPLVSLAAVSRATGRGSLREATWSIARFGASRVSVAAGIVVACVLLGGLVAMGLTSVVVGLAHTTSSPPLARDLVTSVWIAALTGGAYAAWLSFGATLGRRGGGRWVFILLDFVLGRTDFFGAVFPRGNAANLLGFDAPFDIGQRASSLALLLVSLLVAVIAIWRSRD